MLCLSLGNHVLQQAPGGFPGFPNKAKKGVKITVSQHLLLRQYPPVLIPHMDCPQDSAVSRGGPQVGEPVPEIIFGYVPQKFSAKEGTHGFQFPGNGGIFIGQVGMVRPGINDAQRVPGRGKIEIDS